MAIPLNGPNKEYAGLMSPDGVPLGELQALVGDPNTIFLGANGNSDLATLFSIAIEIGPLAVSVSDHDFIRVTVDNGSGFSWQIPVQDFTGIPSPASEGDDISVGDAAGNQRSVTIEESNGGNTILMGRTDSNVVLLQFGTFAPAPTQNPAPPASMRVSAITHNQGLVRRRIDPLRNHITRTIILQRHSATEPPAPASGEVTFDGLTTTLARNSEWADINLEISGTDPRWIASVEFRYISVLDRWIPVGAWTVHLANNSFRIQYASSSTGPWLASDPGTTELWVRYRLQDGTWATHQTRVASISRAWRNIRVLFLPGGQVSITESVSQMDLDQFELISFQYQEDTNDGVLGTQGNAIPLLISSRDILSASASDGSVQENSLVYSFPRLGPSWMVRGNYAFPNNSAYESWYQDASAAEQRGHINFGGTVTGDPLFSSLRWFRGFSTNPATLRIRGI